MAKSTAADIAHLEVLATIPKTKAFLGREFLTWLWWHVETTETEHTVADPSSGKRLAFDAWIDDRLVLEAGHGLSHEDVLKGGDPSRSDEASAGIASGKTVKELKLGLHIHGVGDYSAVFGGD